MASEELEKVLGLLKKNATAGPMSIVERRAFMEEKSFPRHDDVAYDPVDAAGVSSLWVTAPGVAEDRVVLYLHGGGYVLGSLVSHQDLVARISKAANARVLYIDYRLGPEHPFPAAVEDAAATYRWLLAEGVESSRIAIAGDSAGGGLTVAAMVSLRDNGDPLPAAAVCISPWVDLEGVGDSMTSNADVDPMVQKQGVVERAQIGLTLLKDAILELALANPKGVTNAQVARELGLQSESGGGQQDYLSYSALGLLMRDGRIQKRGRRYFSSSS